LVALFVYKVQDVSEMEINIHNRFINMFICLKKTFLLTLHSRSDYALVLVEKCSTVNAIHLHSWFSNCILKSLYIF